MRKQTDYYFSNVELITDDGIFLENKTSLTSIQSTSKSSDSFFIDESAIDDRLRMVFQFFSDKKIRRIERDYDKISDLLAKIGGVLNVLIFIGFIFARFEQELSLKMSILNSLFLFEDSELKKSTSIPKYQYKCNDILVPKNYDKPENNEEKFQKEPEYKATMHAEKHTESIQKSNHLIFSKLSEKKIDSDPCLEIKSSFESGEIHSPESLDKKKERKLDIDQNSPSRKNF